jgi:signal peptidase II
MTERQNQPSPLDPAPGPQATSETDWTNGTSPVDDSLPPVRRRYLTALVPGIAVLVWLVDQGTKALAVARLTGRGRIEIIGDAFSFQLVRNPGAAFSMATGATWVLTVIALVVVVTIVRIARRLGSTGWAVALGLLLGGAIGNLTDRLTRAPGFFRGHVVDFMEFPHWPVFNVADSCISVAAVLIALLSLRGIGIDGRVQLSRDSHVDSHVDAVTNAVTNPGTSDPGTNPGVDPGPDRGVDRG